jgi:hypothetical protein
MVLKRRIALMLNNSYQAEIPNPDYDPSEPWREPEFIYEPIDSIQQIAAEVHIDSYPEEFGAYWNSRDLGYDNEGPFSAGGLNPIWNVTGDAIGVFFGVGRHTFFTQDYPIVTEEPN